MFSATESLKMMRQNAWGALESNAQNPLSFTITLSECLETTGVTLVSTERAQKLVPPEVKLLNNDQRVTPLVILAIKGKMAVADAIAKPSAFVQVGLIIAPVDGTGDVNTYLLSHYTSDANLVSHLQALGFDAHFTPDMAYGATRGRDSGTTAIAVPSRQDAEFTMAGITRPPTVPGTFIANWWAKVNLGSDSRLMKMNSSVPAMLRGEANLTLTTDAKSMLGRLVGSESTGFSVAQAFNSFDRAQTAVSLLPLPA